MKAGFVSLAVICTASACWQPALGQEATPGDLAKAPHEDSGYWLLVKLTEAESRVLRANGSGGNAGGPNSSLRSGAGELASGSTSLVLDEDDLKHFPRPLWPYIRSTDLVGLFGAMTGAQRTALGVPEITALPDSGLVVSEEYLKYYPRWMWPYIRGNDIGGLFYEMTEAQRLSIGVVDFENSRYSQSLTAQKVMRAQAFEMRGSVVGMFVEGTPLEDIPFDILTKGMGRRMVIIRAE